jgi:hypothetical protein
MPLILEERDLLYWLRCEGPEIPLKENSKADFTDYVTEEYYFCSRRAVTRGGPPAWGLGVGLTTPHRKKNWLRKLLKKHLVASRVVLNSI